MPTTVLACQTSEIDVNSTATLLHQRVTSELTTTVLIIMLLVFAPTILLDLIILVVLASTKSLRTTPSAYACSLATSDIVYSLMITCLSCYGLSGHDVSNFDSENMDLFHFLWMFSTNANYNSFLAMSLDAWLYIARPFDYARYMGKKVTAICIVFIWASAVVFNLLYMYPDFEYYFGRYIFPIVHTIYCSTIICVFAHIAVISHRQIKAVARAGPSGNNFTGSSRHFAKHWRALSIFITAFGFFVVTLSPYVFVNAVYETRRDDNYLFSLRTKMIFLSSIHYCCNFFIFLYFKREFRNSLKRHVFRVFRFCKRKVRIHPKDFKVNTVSLNEREITGPCTHTGMPTI